MNVSPQFGWQRLQILMICEGMEATDLISGVGISLSLAKKLMCGEREPSRLMVQKIENFFGKRIWSTPQEWRKRLRSKHTQRASSKRKI